MKLQYNEKFVENFIKEFPKAFIGEDLKLLRQQPTIEGFRPDLIFEDHFGIPVIVEVQLDALDRGHLYRVVEYRDSLIEKGSDAKTRVVLFCNSIPERYVRLLKTHRVEAITLSKEDFIGRARTLKAGMVISGIDTSPFEDEDASPSANRIFDCFSMVPKRRHPSSLVSTIAFWTRSWQTRYDSHHLTCPLEPKEKHRLHAILAPVETRVSSNISSIKPDQLFPMGLLLDIILAFCNHTDALTDEIVIGPRADPDLYDYEDYLYGDGRKRLLRALRLYFSRDEGRTLDILKITSVFCVLQETKLYAGDYPSYLPVSLCEDFEVLDGPGHLADNWEKKKELFHSQGKDAKIAEWLKWDSTHQWTTIHFHKLNSSYVEAMKDFLHHVAYHSNREANQLILHKRCKQCLRKPAMLNSINPDALKLSSRFFAHL